MHYTKEHLRPIFYNSLNSSKAFLPDFDKADSIVRALNHLSTSDTNDDSSETNIDTNINFIKWANREFCFNETSANKSLKKVLCRRSTGRAIITREHIFDLLYDVHFGQSHCRRDVMLKILTKTYDNVTRSIVDRFLALCPVCAEKRTSKKYIMITKNRTSSITMDIIETQSKNTENGGERNLTNIHIKTEANDVECMNENDSQQDDENESFSNETNDEHYDQTNGLILRMPADSPNCTLDKFTTSPSTVNMTTIVTPAILLSNGTTKGSLLPTPQLTRSTSPRLETRQLNKLRRFLSTLYHFGSDISSEIGERVKTLILSIVNNAVSVEEFHAKVQQITNFPLRPFALPFLKTTLPLLQKDILYMARQAKQSTAQFISQREDLIFLPREISEISTKDFNENGKRKLNDDLRELDDKQYPSKHSSTACTSPPLMHPNLSLKNNSFYSTITTSTTNSYSTSSSNRLVDTMRRDFKDKERSFTAYLREYASDFKDITDKTMDDDWKNAESMLNCVLDMVTKAKRALFILQQKDTHLRRLVETNDLEWRRRHSELLTQTEDRIMEVRRKAEETVIEIKRQGLIDIQKAVSNSEQKSSELLTCEREQFQRITQEVKQKSFEDAYTLLNIQEDGPEQCWHCGRKAIETCSGCSVARYCGLFCQHRDWSLHQKLCGPDLKQKLTENLLCGGTRRAYKIQTSTISPNNNNHQHMQNNVTTTTSDLPPSIKTSSTPVLIETSHSTCTTPLLYVSSPPTDEPEHTSTLDTTINHQQHDSNALNITTTTSVVKTEVFEEQNG